MRIDELRALLPEYSNLPDDLFLQKIRDYSGYDPTYEPPDLTHGGVTMPGMPGPEPGTVEKSPLHRLSGALSGALAGVSGYPTDTALQALAGTVQQGQNIHDLGNLATFGLENKAERALFGTDVTSALQKYAVSPLLSMQSDEYLAREQKAAKESALAKDTPGEASVTGWLKNLYDQAAPTLTDPRLLSGQIAQSAPSVLGAGYITKMLTPVEAIAGRTFDAYMANTANKAKFAHLPADAATQALQAEAMAAAKTAVAKQATATAGAVETGQSAGSVGTGVHTTIMDKTQVPDEELMQNPEIAARVHASQDPQAELDQARMDLADKASLIGTASAIPFAWASTQFGGAKMLASIFVKEARDIATTPLSRAFLPRAVRAAGQTLGGAGTEGGQETFQSGNEQLAQNLAEKATFRPDKPLFEDVGTSAIQGGVVGAIMGTPMGIASHGEAAPIAQPTPLQQAATPAAQPAAASTVSHSAASALLAVHKGQVPDPAGLAELVQAGAVTVDANGVPTITDGGRALGQAISTGQVTIGPAPAPVAPATPPLNPAAQHALQQAQAISQPAVVSPQTIDQNLGIDQGQPRTAEDFQAAIQNQEAQKEAEQTTVAYTERKINPETGAEEEVPVTIAEDEHRQTMAVLQQGLENMGTRPIAPPTMAGETVTQKAQRGAATPEDVSAAIQERIDLHEQKAAELKAKLDESNQRATQKTPEAKELDRQMKRALAVHQAAAKEAKAAQKTASKMPAVGFLADTLSGLHNPQDAHEIMSELGKIPDKELDAKTRKALTKLVARMQEKGEPLEVALHKMWGTKLEKAPPRIKQAMKRIVSARATAAIAKEAARQAQPTEPNPAQAVGEALSQVPAMPSGAMGGLGTPAPLEAPAAPETPAPAAPAPEPAPVTTENIDEPHPLASIPESFAPPKTVKAKKPPKRSAKADRTWMAETADSFVSSLKAAADKAGFDLAIVGSVAKKGKSVHDLDVTVTPKPERADDFDGEAFETSLAELGKTQETGNPDIETITELRMPDGRVVDFYYQEPAAPAAEAAAPAPAPAVAAPTPEPTPAPAVEKPAPAPEPASPKTEAIAPKPAAPETKKPLVVAKAEAAPKPPAQPKSERVVSRDDKVEAMQGIIDGRGKVKEDDVDPQVLAALKDAGMVVNRGSSKFLMVTPPGRQFITKAKGEPIETPEDIAEQNTGLQFMKVPDELSSSEVTDYEAANKAYEQASHVTTYDDLTTEPPPPPDESNIGPIGAPNTWTDKFRKWFGGSKITNSDGSPRRGFHGTAQPNIKTMKAKQAGAIFITFDPDFAEDFANYSEDWMKRHGMDKKAAKNIMPVYVRAENPFDYENADHVKDAVEHRLAVLTEQNKDRPMPDSRTPEQFTRDTHENELHDLYSIGHWSFIEQPGNIDFLKSMGYDAFYVKESGRKNLAVFHPNQIKSAVGNTGDYSRKDNRILHMKGLNGNEQKKVIALDRMMAPVVNTSKVPVRATGTGLPAEQRVRNKLVISADKKHIVHIQDAILDLIKAGIPEHVISPVVFKTFANDGPYGSNVGYYDGEIGLNDLLMRAFTNTDEGKRLIRFMIAHEVGHHIDALIGKPSLRDDPTFGFHINKNGKVELTGYVINEIYDAYRMDAGGLKIVLAYPFYTPIDTNNFFIKQAESFAQLVALHVISPELAGEHIMQGTEMMKRIFNELSNRPKQPPKHPVSGKVRASGSAMGIPVESMAGSGRKNQPSIGEQYASEGVGRGQSTETDRGDRGLVPEVPTEEVGRDQPVEPLFMKAPEEGTKAFTQMFPDTKVVEAGQPKEVYHGTVNDFLEFDPSKAGINSNEGTAAMGFWFSDKPEEAEAAVTTGKQGEMEPTGAKRSKKIDVIIPGERLLPVYLNITNPYNMPEKQYFSLMLKKPEDVQAFAETLKDQGHDGIITDPLTIGGKKFTYYAAFTPEQVKSKFNTNPQPDSKLFMEMPAVPANIPSSLGALIQQLQAGTPVTPPVIQPTQNAPGVIGVPEESRLDVLQRRFQDKMNRILKVQKTITKAGGTVDNPENVHEIEQQMAGKITYMIDKFDKEQWTPFVEELAASGMSQEQIDLWLYAKHAEERNVHISNLHMKSGKFQDGGSGMTNADARAILSGGTPTDPDWKHTTGFTPQERIKLDRLAARVYDMQKKKTNLLLAAGLIDANIHRLWTHQFRYYVPLKDEDSMGHPTMGRGFSVTGPESKRTLGRNSKAGSPLLNTVRDYQKAIVRSQKSLIGKALLKLVRKFPNIKMADGRDVWELQHRNQHVQMIYDPRTGQVYVKHDPMMKFDDDIFIVKENGKDVFIRINDQSLMEQMKNMGDQAMPRWLAYIGMPTRLLSQLMTGYNPEFWANNFVKDIQEALINIQADQDVKGRIGSAKQLGRKLAMYAPGAAAGIARAEMGGNTTHEWSKWYEDFQANGGKVGFYNLKQVSGLAQDLESDLAKLGNDPKAIALRIKDFLIDGVSNFNAVFENATRLACYRAAVEAGVPRQTAAIVAKNLTVNFNKRGEWSSNAGVAYYFFNASIQGAVRNTKAVVQSRRVQGLMLLMMAFGAMMRWFQDDDIDEKTGDRFIDEQSLYTQDHNIIFPSYFPVVGGHKIVLPYTYNLAYVIGNRGMAAIQTGDYAKEIARILRAGFEAYDPVNSTEGKTIGVSLAKAITPSIVKGAAENMFNQNFMGAPVHPDEKYGGDKPHSQQYFKNATSASIAIAQGLNKLTGGDTVERGWLDPYPNDLDHLVESALGGVAKTITGTANTIRDVAKGEPVDWSQVPIARKFNADVPRGELSTRFYGIGGQMELLKKEANMIKNREYTGKEFDPFKFHDEYVKNRWTLMAYEQAKKNIKQYRDTIKELEKQETPNQQAIDALNKLSDAEKQQVIRVWNASGGERP